jgi:CheY-like chemotaxis protein
LAQSGLIVLLVENDPQLRRAITILVESWGVSVIEADDAKSARQLLQDLEISPDVLLLDHQLGAGLSGTALYEEIVDDIGPLPCAILSADRSADLRDACVRLGLSLLSKPLDRHKLGQFLDASARAAAGP